MQTRVFWLILTSHNDHLYKHTTSRLLITDEEHNQLLYDPYKSYAI